MTSLHCSDGIRGLSRRITRVHVVPLKYRETTHTAVNREDKKINKQTKAFIPSILTVYLSLVFSCLEKQKRELDDDPPLPACQSCVYIFQIHENMLMKVRLIRRSSESCDPWAKGSKGTRGWWWWWGGAPLPQTKGAVPTCLHLLWEGVALCIMETQIA